MNRSATEFMQYRKPVGLGPSSKTCPRCASHRRHEMASRVIPNVVSVVFTMFKAEIGCQKLGQPVPESNFVLESYSAVSQQMHR